MSNYQTKLSLSNEWYCGENQCLIMYSNFIKNFESNIIKSTLEILIYDPTLELGRNSRLKEIPLL